jgi:hypothetical protein
MMIKNNIISPTMKRKINYIAIVTLMLTSSACENKSRHTESVIFDNHSVIEQSVPDSTSSVQEETPKTAAPVSSSPSSSHTQKSSSYDNMRGFDPASEDDMDDNGMSRYMENNDEEGWD